MQILNRYIWKEFIQQFLICGAAFTVLGIAKNFFDYNDFLIGYHVNLSVTWLLLSDLIPSLWMDVLPAAAIFGIVLALGRLLRERELDVIRISGASIIRIMMPIFIGVFLICFGVYWWNDLVVPAANHHFQTEIKRLSMQEDMPLLRENVVFKGPQNRFIYLRKVQNREKKILGILILEANTGKWPRLITAEYGMIRRGVWQLYNGVVHEIDDQGAIKTELTYSKMEIKMAVDYGAIVDQDRSPSEMRASELLEKINTFKQSGMNEPVYAVFYHAKFADPVISLVLVFLAVPLLILTGRTSRWLNLVFCFLIIMGYYAMQVIARNMGANSLIAPWEAAWVPHLVFLTAGITLMIVMEQRR